MSGARHWKQLVEAAKQKQYDAVIQQGPRSFGTVSGVRRGRERL